MGSFEQIDQRIAQIMAKIDALRDREFGITCGQWPVKWEPPASENEVAAFEKQHGIRLPEDYRRFITTAYSAGSQPFYGLIRFNKFHRELASVLEEPFPYTLDNSIYFLYMTEEEMDEFYGGEDDEDDGDNVDCGLLPLCTEGCGMDSVLVVNSRDPDTYGTVWFYDLANDVGIIPLYDEKTGKPFHFLDWLEYWAGRTAALGDDEYFSFSDTAKLPPIPDNPEIMGRKMGWIKDE
ncbi:MAG: SMI1/KNR4 family protein [Oscillospiraceae bacterium]|nr:SMI1/KNR4 family protein [Oscillospiraceae bacterium]